MLEKLKNIFKLNNFFNYSSIISDDRQTKINVNGKKIVLPGNGHNIKINNGKIFINGHEYIEGEEKTFNITQVVIEGNPNIVESDCSITINGSSSKVRAENSVFIEGDVTGNIEAGNSVEIKGNQKGFIKAGNSVIIKGNKYE